MLKDEAGGGLVRGCVYVRRVCHVCVTRVPQGVVYGVRGSQPILSIFWPCCTLRVCAGPGGDVEETTLRRLLYLFHSLVVMASEVRPEEEAWVGPGVPAAKVSAVYSQLSGVW